MFLKSNKIKLALAAGVVFSSFLFGGVAKADNCWCKIGDICKPINFNYSGGETCVDKCEYDNSGQVIWVDSRARQYYSGGDQLPDRVFNGYGCLAQGKCWCKDTDNKCYATDLLGNDSECNKMCKSVNNNFVQFFYGNLLNKKRRQRAVFKGSSSGLLCSAPRGAGNIFVLVRRTSLILHSCFIGRKI